VAIATTREEWEAQAAHATLIQKATVELNEWVQDRPHRESVAQLAENLGKLVRMVKEIQEALTARAKKAVSGVPPVDPTATPKT